MKIKIAIIAALIALFGVEAHSQSFREVYEKNLNARGGEATVKSLNTYIITGKLVREDSVDFNFRAAFKMPNKAIIEYYSAGDTLAIGYDGKQGWTLMPQISIAPIELPEANVQEAIGYTVMPIINYFGLLDTYRTAKVKLSDNKDSVDGVPNYQLMCQKPNGEADIVLMNKTDYLISRINTAQTINQYKQAVVVELKDYRKAGDVTMPYYVKISGKKGNIAEVTVETIEVNPVLQDIIFEMPK